MTDIENDDYARLLEIATGKAIDSNKIEIMPTLDPNKYSDLREIIFPDAKPRKSPDLRIDGVLWEEELSSNSTNINNVKHAIRSGARQADHVIITLSEELTDETLKRIVIGRWIDHKDLKEVIFRFGGKEWNYKRP